MSNALTFDSLVRAIRPILYYSAIEFIEQGKAVRVKATDNRPEFIVIHPDDLEMVQAKLPYRQLVSLSEYREGSLGPPAIA